MKNVGTMHRAVNSNRNGIRRPPRSEIAPRTGDTMALMPTLTMTARDRATAPSCGPNRSLRYRPMAPDTTAKLKIVLAKSYNDHATGTTARPDGVSPARPPARVAGPPRGASATAR